MPTDFPETEIRPAVAADAASVTALYLACVRSGAGSFEDAADRETVLQRVRGVLDLGAPFLVACQPGVAGVAHVAPYHPRAGFGHCVRSQIWIAPQQRGRGRGPALPARPLAALPQG